MIIDLVLVLVKGVLEILLLPLTAINVVVDVASSVPVVTEFLTIVAYVLPWTNILPLIIIVVGVVSFKIVLSLIKLIWHFIPIIGN